MGSDSQGSEPELGDAVRHCFVLCRAAEPSDLSQASQVVAQTLGSDYAAEVANNIVTVTHGGQVVGFLAHVPAPVPNHEAEEHAAGNLLWPNGNAEAAKHRSHVIVTNMGAEYRSPIQSAVAVTRLALAALQLFDGIGVYWGDASVSNSREVFEEFCEGVSEDNLPVPVWLRFQLVPAADNEFGVYTLGMSQFGLMEVEVARSPMEPQELVEFVANIANYLIQNGPVIADGDTVGGSEDERILVRHEASVADQGRRVYQIVFPG